MGVSKRILFLSFILVCTMAVLIGCQKTVPVANPTGLMPATAASVKKAKIAEAIIQAGQITGWVITPDGEGKMTGTLRIRTHTAVVSITYDAMSYHIDYKDSVNLKYKDGKIHPYYNGWVRNLDKNISLKLTDLNK
ncbi:MAG: hypothetical protein LBB66_06785 [Desulfovibrio sp.]|jgi:hypothetical protein|nr:hypothetical protein [Desulfovibrio sp.]